MRTLINWIISRLKNRQQPGDATMKLLHRNRRIRRLDRNYRIHADGTVTMRRGWRKIRISHSDFLLIAQLKGWQS